MEFPKLEPKIEYIDEPNLEFGHKQLSDNPKDGLFLYGPYNNSRLSEISVGVIGSQKGVEYFKEWVTTLDACISLPPPGKRDKQNRLHLASFPGIKEAFNISIDLSRVVSKFINVESIERFTKTENQHEAVSKVVDLFIKEIEHHHNNEEKRIDVWVFVLPEIIFERCKPLSKRSGLELTKGDFTKKQKIKTDLPLFQDVIDQTDENIFDDVPDFHRQVKARLLKLGYPSQLIRETTIAPQQFLNAVGKPKRRLQDPSSVAWNLTTGLYYKTQAEPPWKLASVRPGVCYIGLVFKMIPNDKLQHACCAAQMFLNEGDAVVFRGANGPWKTGEYDFHLKAREAKELVSKVLNTFIEKNGIPPKEFFIHGGTNFNDEEWNAFAESAPEGTNLVGVRIKTTNGDSKLFRNGDYPVLRGTALIIDESNAYLWTTGFAPRIDTYIGPETPNPLMITILKHTGEKPDIRNVLSDILGLTKINYNACNYNDGLPVTIRFANKVGEVLVMGSARNAEKQPLKFYI
jgi:hypothetical protein